MASCMTVVSGFMASAMNDLPVTSSTTASEIITAAPITPTATSTGLAVKTPAAIVATVNIAPTTLPMQPMVLCSASALRTSSRYFSDSSCMCS
ncbi:hypothetical protein FQZ97_1066710 [compost metagenome]